MGKREQTKSGKDSDKDIVSNNAELQAVISNIVSAAISDLVEEIKELKNHVNELETTNTAMLSLIKNQSFMCTNCRSSANNDNDILLNNSTCSDDSSCTVIAAPKEKQSQKSKPAHMVKNTDNSSNHNKITKTLNSRSDFKKTGTNLYSKIVIGTNAHADDDPESFFEAPTPRLWLYVGRCRAGTTESQVINYLNKKIPHHTFEVVKLKSQGINQSYRVAADMALREQLYDPSFWPTGVVVKKFNFPRGIARVQGDFLETTTSG